MRNCAAAGSNPFEARDRIEIPDWRHVAASDRLSRVANGRPPRLRRTAAMRI